MDPESTDGEAAAAVPLPQALRAKISEMIYVSKGPGAEQRKLEAQLRACETYAQLRRFLKKQLKHMSTLGLMAVQVALCTLHVTRIPCLGSSVRPDATLRAHTRSSCWMRDGRPGSAGPRWPWSVRWRPAPSAGPRSAGRRPGRSLPGNPPAARNPPWLPGRGGQPRPSRFGIKLRRVGCAHRARQCGRRRRWWWTGRGRGRPAPDRRRARTSVGRYRAGSRPKSTPGRPRCSWPLQETPAATRPVMVQCPRDRRERANWRTRRRCQRGAALRGVGSSSSGRSGACCHRSCSGSMGTGPELPQCMCSRSLLRSRRHLLCEHHSPLLLPSS